MIESSRDRVAFDGELTPVLTRRHVAATLGLAVSTAADIVMSVAVADTIKCDTEQVDVMHNDEPIEPALITASHGSRLHVLRSVAPGVMTIRYTAVSTGAAEPIALEPDDWYRYIRPSRYCESDRLGPFARGEFEGLAGTDLLAGVSSWVGSHIAYVPGSSRPIDGAVSTLLAQEGVCRDFAHLTVALLRANGVPARVVSVYAPGLHPMDFHAVAEACLDDAWYVVDPTCLAPRSSLVRIATGADAADTAFLSVVSGVVELVDLEVAAVVEPTLPTDDLEELVQLR